jgi:acyl-CoA synthetase (AMP-forming)/AMP-acid ligase II
MNDLAPAPATLLHVLAERARETPEKVAVTYEEDRLTFGELWRDGETAAATFELGGVGRTDRIVVALPNGLDFFPAFYGAHLAGAVAVPVFPGVPARRLAEIAARCRASAVVVADERAAEVAAQLGPAVRGFSPSMLRDGRSRSHRSATLRLPAPEDVAFIQYTSGSTGEPKGVLLSHGSLVKNVRQMIAGMEITASERFVSWLPVYHDMGLILKTMVPMFLGAETHLLATSLRDVDRWLDAIERLRATFTAAPDFGWRLCLRRSLDRSYDLSSLRVALNAAEPVRAETIRDFERRFGLRQVMAVGYGLAEATVGVAMTKPGTAPSVDDRGAVSVGRPFPGVEVEIRREGRPCAPGVTGDVHVRSLANSSGYFEDPEATAALFDASGFLSTGDVGYRDSGGELVILGRSKSSIIVAGRTVAPREVEEAAEASPLVRFAAALGVDRGDRAGEQIVVVVEVRDVSAGSEALEDTRRAVVRAVNDKIGLRPVEVLIVAPHTIPTTHNGKIQHATLRALYLARALADVGGAA